MGIFQSLAAAFGVLDGCSGDRRHQRRLRQARRSGAPGFHGRDPIGRVDVAAAARADAAWFRSLGLSCSDAVSQLSRERHSAGDCRAAPASRRGPHETAVAAARLRQDRADHIGALERRLDRPRGADGAGRRVLHAGGRAVRRHGAGKGADPCRLRRRYRGCLQYAACRYRLCHRGDEPHV
ncbi:hypothetical protein RHSP_82664 [Rhizobium freirei PRF 81]|uniref:Uncharacterized protein n=1 Tax=Rhizobium freirei PRF 81 TaxID=363754 RepID=N6V539_9HYPH|nr:hypothetical protein RHSP_82664 [Rhizobium freirei PRF 81]